jgi:hypothetical protein
VFHDVTTPPADSLRLELAVPAEARVGSTIPITLRATNAGDQPVDLYLRGRTITFDIIVRHDRGDVVWRRLQNEVIPAILRIETLAPNQVLELHASWSLGPTAGDPVTPGTYVVEGVLFTDGPELRTAPGSVHVTAG